MKTISDNIKSLLSIMVIGIGFAYFFMCSLRDLKPDPQILIAIVGSFGTVLGYHFGSSSKSNDKATVTSADTVNVTTTTSNPPPQSPNTAISRG